MNRSLTLGEALLRLVAKPYLIERGKEIYSTIKDAALRLAPPCEVVTMIEKFQADYDIKRTTRASLVFADPYKPLVEKLLGHGFPKNGMSAYFVYYIQSLGTVCELERVRQEIDVKIREMKQDRDKIEALLTDFATQFQCEVEGIPDAMERTHKPVHLVDKIRQVLQMAADADRKTAEVKKEAEETFELSYTLFAPLVLMEDLAKWPKAASARAIAIYLIERAANFATQADFEKVKEEAERFLSLPGNLSRIVLLSQGKRK